jgi:predicted nucleic acid-binding Zn ribbon protein
MAEGRPVEKAETILEDLIRRFGMEGKLQEARLDRVWPQVVGPAIAAATRPVRVKNGVLLVQVKSSAWVQELNFRRRDILNRLASYLPSVRLRHIDFRTSWQPEAAAPEEEEAPPGPPLPTLHELESMALQPAEQEQIETVVAHLSDEEMRETLRRTMTHDLQSRKWRIQHGWKPCPRCQAIFYGDEERCPICRVEGGPPGTSARR